VKVLAARNGILGALREELIDTSKEPLAAIRALAHTPGGAFGSCRVKLKSLEADRARYERLLEVLRAHDVRWFLYNGGNDSADTALKVSRLAQEFGYPLTCVGVPKTIDNDLAVTDCCPGFGSAAKYTAVSVRECALDVAAMADTSTKVFVYEAMGRHAGWLAGVRGPGGAAEGEAPHIILFPERAYVEARLLRPRRPRWQRVRLLRGRCQRRHPHGRRHLRRRRRSAARMPSGTRNSAASRRTWPRRVEGRPRLQGALGVAGYLQRSARHVASKTDLEQAQAVGTAAVDYALKGMNATMPVIVRTSDAPYRWKIAPASNSTTSPTTKRRCPRPSCARMVTASPPPRARYLEPLIRGEAPPPYGRDGLPKYVALKNVAVKQKLPAFKD
jgi:6-phosphofructokinase 1